MRTSNLRSRALQLTLIVALAACASDRTSDAQDVAAQDSKPPSAEQDTVDGCTGCRVVAPPPNVPMVLVDAGIDRSWLWGRPQTVLHLHLNPTLVASTPAVYLGYGGAPGDPQYRERELEFTKRGGAHELVIQYDRGSGRFLGALGNHSFRFDGDDGDDDDTGWDDVTMPTVHLTGYTAEEYVKVQVVRADADMTLILRNAKFP